MYIPINTLTYILLFCDGTTAYENILETNEKLQLMMCYMSKFPPNIIKFIIVKVCTLDKYVCVLKSVYIYLCGIWKCVVLF